MDQGAFSSSTPLHIGDYIALRLSKPEDGWLSSEGLLDDDCFITQGTDNFYDSIWEIHVQNQYNASVEYKEALAQSMTSKTTDTATAKGKKKQITTEYLSQLHRAALNEQRLNEKLMNLKKGKPISYGDPIQLRHVKSQKFLTISSNIVAREERENMKVYLDSEGDAFSGVGFLPRYKFEKEGQALTNLSDVSIRLHERHGDHVHAAKVTGGSRTEVNCSLDHTFWTLVLYQRAVDLFPKSVVAGQYVTLQDPETLACLALDHHIPGLAERSQVILSQINESDSLGTELLWLVENVNVVTGGPLTINVDQVTFRNLNTGLFMKMDADGLIAVKDRNDASIFEFNDVQGSNTPFATFMETQDTFHLWTDNMWIGYRNNNDSENIMKNGARCIGFTDKSYAISLSLNTSLFHKYGVNLYVGVGATLKLRKLLAATEQYEAGTLTIKDLAQQVKACNTILLNLCAFLALPESTSIAHVEHRSLLDNNQLKDIIRARQNIMREQGLIDVLLDLLSAAESNIYDKIKESVEKKDLLRNSARRIQRKTSVSLIPKEKPEEELPVPIPDSSPPPRRASLRALFGGKQSGTEIDTTSKPVTPSIGTSPKPKTMEELVAQHESGALKVLNKSGSDSESDSDDEDDEYDDDDGQRGDGPLNETKLTVSQAFAQKCLKVLLCCLIDNPANQIHVADRFPVLLAEVRDHRMAVLCVEEMLKTNLTILQTKVRQREIDIFVGLLAQSEMSVTFLRLLQSTTRCPMGVDATQRMVVKALFSMIEQRRSMSTSERADLVAFPLNRIGGSESRKSLNIAVESTKSANQNLIIQVVANRNKKTPVDWGNLSMFCPLDPRKVVKGYDKLADGLPELWLQWKMKGNTGEFGMGKLFGYYDKVPFSVIFSCTRMTATAKRKSVNSAGSQAFESISAKAFQRQMTVYQKKSGQYSKANRNQGNSKVNQAIANIALCKSQVAEYFRTQLYLVADLCLDRNYVSIGLLEPLFEYDILVAIFKDPTVPASFKAPVCRVLRCLYVDRDPQIVQQFPRYVRTLLSLDNDPNSRDEKDANLAQQLQAADDSKLYAFVLIQKLLSEYIRDELDLSHCDELSAEAIELLQALVKFGFYTEVPQILDIWKPMMKILAELQISSASKKKSNTRGRSLTGLLRSKWTNGSKNPNVSENEAPEDSENISEPLVKKMPWFEQWSARTDSLTWMMVVFIVVTVSITMMVIQQFYELDLTIFYFATTIFFGLEYLFRLVVNSLGSQGLTKFCCDRFNVLDLGLVLLDVVVLIMGAAGSEFSASRATRSLRIIRIFRVARIVRATRLLRQMAAANRRKVWEIPKRYRNIKSYEAKTIVNILKILTMFYGRIQDSTLEHALQAFAQWCMAIRNNQNCNPIETFQREMASEEKLSAQLSQRFDAVLLDLLMYSDANITHHALHLLMIHTSHKDRFYDVFQNTQIIYSPRIDSVCKQMTRTINELKGLAEMFEIWSELESEQDMKSANRVLELLNTMKGYLMKRNDDASLSLRCLVLVDEEVQNIMRSLDAMAAFMMLQETLYDGGREELRPVIRDILKSCNDLICVFVKTCEANQHVAFKYFSWFMERSEDNVNSLVTARAILEGNKALIKQCPRQYLHDCALKIASNGHRPDYLELFVGMTALSDVMNSRVTAVDIEIGSFLSGREWKKHMLLWCGSAPESPEYQERVRAMEAVRNQHRDTVINDEHLSPQLQYHVYLLTLLTNCNLGPKLHPIYSVQDILSAIMDPVTLFPVKRALGQLLVESVKHSHDRIEKLDSFWQLLDQITIELETLPREMFNLFRNQRLRIQKGEWIQIIVNLIRAFFQSFDFSTFVETNHHASLDKVIISSPNQVKGKGRGNKKVVVEHPVMVVVKRVHRALNVLVDQYAMKIGGALSDEVVAAINVLHRHIQEQNKGQDPTFLMGVFKQDNKLKSVRMKHQRTSIVFADVQQAYYRQYFLQFLEQIKDVSTTSRDEIINIFKYIPSMFDVVSSSTSKKSGTNDKFRGNIRFEPLIQKLTTHFREVIRRSSLNRSMEQANVQTCVWFLKAMRYLFEDALSVTFENIANSDPGSVVTSKEADRLRSVFNDQGITYLCLDLMALGMEQEIATEAMKMLIMLLFKSGGCLEIQTSVYEFLFETDSRLFFEFIKDMIDSVKTWCNKDSDGGILMKDEESLRQAFANTPEAALVFPFLQSICEGSFMKNREQIREQTGNSKIINILDSLANLLGVMSGSEWLLSHPVLVTVMKTVLRLVQGPCKGNQDKFILQTELLMAINRMIRTARPDISESSIHDKVEPMKEAIVDVLMGILEGQSKESISFERVLTTIDLSVLQLLILPVEEDILASLLSSQQRSIVQVKFIALSESIKKSSFVEIPTKQVQGNIATSDDYRKDDVTSIEIKWNSQVHVVYFPIPQFVKDLSNESKQHTIKQEEDFPSRDLKLVDFVHKVKTLYREGAHQQYLKTKLGLSDIWTFKYYLTRFMFANAIVMNVLIVAYYGTSYHANHYYGGATHVGGSTDDHGATDTTDDHAAVATDDHHRILAGSVSASATYDIHDNLYVPHKIEIVLTWLNIFHFALSIIAAGIFCLVRIPVTFATEYEKHKTYISAIVNTVLDPLPVWYFVYCVFTFLGLEVHHFFVSALLLDWIAIDSTSQDLLKAIKHPAKQLAATLFIILIMQNIFAGIMFIYFRHEVKTVQIRDMWDALKLCISYGFRGEYGIDYEMSPTLGVRMIYDVIFFMIILSILRHIFFAVIIHTFDEIREMKTEREAEAKNTCFICGIESHEYDRIMPSGTPLTFANHCKEIHNPFSYMTYILKIWSQPQSHDNSLEIYVRECLKKGDVSWFPSGIFQELNLPVAEAHVIENDGDPESGHGKGGHGKGHGDHGHKKGHGDDEKNHGTHAVATPAPEKHERKLSTHEMSTPIHRRGSGITDHPHSTVKDHSHNNGLHSDEQALLDHMHTMHQQLLSIGVSMDKKNVEDLPTTGKSLFDSVDTSAAIATAIALANSDQDKDINPPIVSASIEDPPPTVHVTRIETSPALLEAVANANITMTAMIERMNKMEKKLYRSHKYLRHRLRRNMGIQPPKKLNPVIPPLRGAGTSTIGKALPHPLAHIPNGSAMLTTKKSKVEEVFDDDEDDGEEEWIFPAVNEPVNNLLEENQQDIAATAATTTNNEPIGNSVKARDSDSESSETSSRCTIHTDNEDEEEEE